MLVCDVCNDIFNKEYIKGDGCPKAGCEGYLIELDDNLVNVLPLLWSVGVETTYSCAGHVWEELFSPYVQFSSYKLEDIENNKEILQKVLDSRQDIKYFKLTDVYTTDLEYRFELTPYEIIFNLKSDSEKINVSGLMIELLGLFFEERVKCEY